MKARFLALAALVLGLASCQNDPEIVNPVGGGEVDFQLAVGVPEFGTRADDGDTKYGFDSAYGAIDYLCDEADPLRTDWTDVDLRYSLEVYDKAESYTDAVPVKDRQVIIVDKYEPVAFNLRLVPGRNYHFVVFADFVPNGSKVEVEGETLTDHHRELGKHHIIGDNLGDITIKNDGINDECTDAYFATKDITISNSAAQDMKLTRPYGKLRVIATDLAELNLNVDPKAVIVKYNYTHPTDFNAVTGVISGEDRNVDQTFDIKYHESVCKLIDENEGKVGLANHVYTEGYDNYNPYGKENENGVKRHTHMTLFTDYILAKDQQEPFKFTMTVIDKNNQPIKETHFNTEIPIQRNFLTTIVGNVLTTATEINVTIDDNFSNANNWTDKPFYQEVWDGETLTKPTTPAVDENGNVIANTLVISQPSELAWFAAAVNGTLVESNSTRANEEYTKMNFVLTQDINLNNEAWTPIGTSSKPYNGTFNGQGHKISNLFVDGGSSSNQGLFGVTHDGEIKNLVVENAKVSGRLNVAVVCGQPYTSKYTNITVKGHVEVNGLAYVGGVGGKNAYADWTDVTVVVDEKSYVNAYSIENNTAYRTYVGGVCGFNGEGGHSFKNITSNINVKGSTCDVGGLFGIAHYSNKFENCVCTGDVEIYAAEEADEAQEIGGIAGVWHNATGYSVEMKNCSFTGTLKTNIEGVNFYYGGLVGKPYGDGEGKLVLNGVEFTKDGVNFAKINETLADGFVMPFDLTGKATTSNAYGVTGLNQINGGTLDGKGHTLKVTGAGGTWGSAISTTGGTIKNVTIAQGFRGIFVNHNSTHSEKVVLENVTINGPTYTISCDQGMKQGLEATGCTINGWTSYAATIGEANFTNCSFGKGAGYKFARPYAPTTFVGCNFCEGYEIDARAEVAFIDCTLNGVKLTSENIATLVTGNTANAKVFENVATAEALVAALNAGKSVRFLNDITVAATKGGYDKAGILQNKAQTIDGNGYTLTVTGAGATWDCAIYTNGGTIKNLTVAGAMRGIFTAGTSADLHIKNVTFKNVVYTFNSDGGNNNYGVYVSNSALNGWTSHSNVHKEVVYTNCSFGEGSGYKFCRPYGKTSFVNCTFCPGYSVDKSKTTEITFENCTFEE